jgi:hypothetical protein
MIVELGIPKFDTDNPRLALEFRRESLAWPGRRT